MARYADIDTVRDALYEADAITMKGVRILNQFPTISPDELRGVGEWIEAAGGNYLVCPECKYDHALYDRLGYSCEHEYCPNCGKRLRMKGVSEDG